jgi:general stress protein 26
MLTTIDHVGKMVARPMTLQRTGRNSDLWFLAARDVTEIAQVWCPGSRVHNVGREIAQRL